MPRSSGSQMYELLRHILRDPELLGMVVVFKDRVHYPVDTGYLDHKYKLRLPDGQIVELQVLLAGTEDTFNQQHALHRVERMMINAAAAETPPRTIGYSGGRKGRQDPDLSDDPQSVKERKLLRRM